MSKYLFFLQLLLITLPSSSQDAIKKFVQTNQISISTIADDTSKDDDLEPIGNAIGNASIVMLGEQDHGDAPAYLAKTRLIKYLHEKKGFNVLAFESDFFSLNEGWDKLPKQGQLIDTFLHKNITTLWTDCNSCQNLFYKYIPHTYASGNPLKITGFDSEVFFSHSSKYLYPALDSVLRSIKAPITLSPNYSSEVITLLQNWYINLSDSINISKINSYLAQIEKELKAGLGSNNFWTILANNLFINVVKYQASSDKMKSSQIRDSLMANNLKWLATVKYPKEKIIVWAANSHIRKYSGNFPQPFLNTVNSMGSIFTSDAALNQKTYVMGFTSLHGTAGRLGTEKYKLNKPRKNSFENWINDGTKYAFVNFRNFSTKEELFFMSGLGHNNYEGVWNKIYDGVFFIRDMYPCSK